MTIRTYAAALGLLVFGAASAVGVEPSVEQRMARMMRGESAVQGAELEAAVRKAEDSPLGSQANPVRVAMPAGERGYLARLRCSDGQAPSFSRDGSFGHGPYGNILDRYAVLCAGGAPASSAVFMDMYHAGFAEPRPVPGFTVAQ